MRADHAETTDPVSFVRGLGWLGLATGASKLVLGRSLFARAIGARDVAIATAMLIQPGRTLPLWARVAADAVDLGLLGLSLRSRSASRLRIAGAMAVVAARTAADVAAARRVGRAYRHVKDPVLAAVTINKPPREVYEFFRRLDRLPTFMDYLESVEEIGPSRSRWTAKLPVGGTVSWTAFLTEDTPGEALAWESTDDSRIQTRGRVTFTRTPGRDMTEVRVELELGFTGVAPSTGLAAWFAKPQLKGDLRRLKQVIETGEVLRSDATLHRMPHPAQPPEAPAELPAVFVENPPTAVKGVTP